MRIIKLKLTKIIYKRDFYTFGVCYMIKGINRQVVEVTETDCEYFEKIMFFVKPEYISVSESKIRERAGRIASSAGAPPITKVKKSRVHDVLKTALFFLCGAVTALIVLNIIS